MLVVHLKRSRFQRATTSYSKIRCPVQFPASFRLDEEGLTDVLHPEATHGGVCGNDIKLGGSFAETAQLIRQAQASALAHKSDAGGVELNVTDASIEEAFTRLYANVGKARPDVTLDGVLVERMSGKGVELIIGARTDPEWGPVILVGFGGVLAEAIHDVRLIAADLPHDAIVAELLALKSAALLKGFRNIAARDVDAVARIIARLGVLLRAAPQITEIDLNPVMVYGVGEGALALDALIVSE